ncbi:hypothetical protein ACOQLK_26895, partial [Klebsiella pneumoniae]|uniref:hypothetical protein n=1 Tax=Klebsiella pneumoniae TaxID=573 RepID=UPI00253F96A2
MHVQKHWLFSKTVNEVPRTGKRSNLINFLFCLDLKKNNVTILVIKGSSLVVVAEGMIMVYLIARGHRHGR